MYSDFFVAGLNHRIDQLQSEVAAKNKEIEKLQEAFYAARRSIRDAIGDEAISAVLLGTRTVPADVGAAFAYAVIEKELEAVGLLEYTPDTDKNLVRMKAKYMQLRPKR